MTQQPPTRLVITAISTPDFMDPPDAHEFYAALGQFTVAWGRLEGHLCGCLLSIIALLGQPESVPQQWNDRSKLWKVAFSKIPELAIHQDRAVSFISRFVEETEDRNLAAHAIWGEFVSDALEPTITVRWLRRPASPVKGILVDDRRITLTMVKEAVRVANRLNAEMVEFSRPLHALRPIPDDAVTL